jgi:glycosyltransferase involved in cell wall biosynthesis
MIIITYSETTAETIEQRLGQAEYSYFFIYKKYLPALQKLGTLIAVREPHIEVDKIFHENPNEPCIFLSFSPPHRTLFDLQCPTVCVFAWEFSTIPEESWHNHPEYNWAMSLQRVGNAITISEYAAEIVNKAVPKGLNLAVIPAAVDTVTPQQLTKKPQNVSLHVKATLYDSRAYNLTTDMVSDEVRGSRDPLQIEPWDDREIHLTFSQDDSDSTELLVGFYSSEDWGTWSRTKVPWILLPHKVKGPTNIALELVAYGTNIDREIYISLGDEQRTISIAGLPQLYTLEFNPQSDIDVLKFSNLDLTHAPGARDHRSLGIGIKSMTVSRPLSYKPKAQNRLSGLVKRVSAFARNRRGNSSNEVGNKLELQGIVYTTVLNPQDGRKNWEDMVTAFCWAFRNEPNATLVLKMTHNKLATFLGKLLLLYSQMSPFKCRVVAVHGFLTNDQYQTLMDSTHFVINSSHCEGQCLPLMEFMGQGVPAIAPNHTAMADYVNENNSFIVKSSLYPTYWPIDERKAMRTMCYRIDWNSLKEAFEKSYAVVTSDSEAYQSLRIASIESIRNVAGQEIVYEKMGNFLASTARKATEFSAPL